MVYPKYEEAFRLGLEAFSNPMRVNKFKRPLPHILGTIEFQKQPHAGNTCYSKYFHTKLFYLGIVPTSKLSCSSEIPTPRNSPFSGPSSAAAAQMSSEQLEEYFPGPSTSRVPFEEEPVPSEEQEISEVDHSSHHSDTSVVSPIPKAALEPSSSISQFDGGLFEADYAMSNALEIYRRSEDTSSRKVTVTDEKQPNSSLFSETSLTSIRQQRSSSKSPSERSQMTKDLLQLGKNLSDLQSQRAAENKANSKA